MAKASAHIGAKAKSAATAEVAFMSNNDVSIQSSPVLLAPRKRPRQQRSQTTVDAVLTAAEMLLQRGGPFTTNHIAQRAGVSVGSLYQYFPNKQSIVAALQERRTSQATFRFTGT